MDNFSTGSRENVRSLAGVRVMEGDVNDAAVWRALRGEQFDVIVHYAATVGVQRTLDDPLAVLRDVEGMRRLAAFAQAGGARKIVFASSSEVYGYGGQVPMGEDQAPVGWSPYTTVKLYGEYLFSSLAQQSSVAAVSLRFFNVYGPRQVGNAYGFVVAKFIQQVLAGMPPTVYGDGRQTRDFVYIGDNVQAVVAAIENESSGARVVNVGSGRETAVVELAQAVIRAAGREGELQPVFLPRREVEVQRRCAMPDQLREWLGLECVTTLDEGLAATVAWYRERAVPLGEKVVLPQAAVAVE